MSLNTINGFLVDLDGTIFKGHQLLEGAIEALNVLRKANKKVAFLSNRGNLSRKMCLEKLKNAGIEATVEEIILSSSVTANFLREKYPYSKIWILGEQGLRDEIGLAGLQLARQPEEADWLVISLHESVTYHDLNQAFQATKNGARLIATNADKYFPNENGQAIDVAGMIGAIEASTGKRVEMVIGKPSFLMAEVALRQLGLGAEECLMIGDSYESDIAMGRMFGMKTALVLTGSSLRETIPPYSYQPDYTWKSIAAVGTLLKEGSIL
ncbi:HAD-IIA family hydrolase [Priestia endophytica]|uniref:HAD-IIA family hydrolase n=1 Tax=Priestia endophytica TaxID=135735 RepID=UPI0020414333|nr:HAD-IIA family hydrolase [Priestia endophytica]MCM3540679.1 HAD-IIA family hydrolase [Priestia endophytica]